MKMGREREREREIDERERWRESDGKECLGFERDFESDFRCRARARAKVFGGKVWGVLSQIKV